MSRAGYAVFGLAATIALASVQADAGSGSPPPMTVAQILANGKSVVGNSYWWGHGRVHAGADHASSCQGSCPSCKHQGSYGADCSGFVAKAWQVPNASPLTTDAHPFSTWDFAKPKTQWWSAVSRSAAKAGDAFVYNTSTHGHIVLYDGRRDKWGNYGAYECKGCSYGCVHGMRQLGSAYLARHRKNVEVARAMQSVTPHDAGASDAGKAGDAAPPPPDPSTCTQYAAAHGWSLSTLVCDTSGSGACFGQGVATSDCAKCCNLGCADDSSCPGGSVCAWNGTGKCCRATAAATTICFSDAECSNGQVCAWNGEHFYCAAPRCGG